MISFQAVSWYAKDIEDEDEDTRDYQIVIFGRTFDGKSICVKTLYKPYFYIEVPKKWKHSNAVYVIQSLKRRLYAYGDDVVSWNLEEHTKMYGYTNKENFKFLKITFKSLIAWKKAGWVFKKPLKVLGKEEIFQPYESNLDPMLRFGHEQNIPFSCCISIDKYELIESESANRYSNCDIELKVKCTDINRDTQRDDIAPLVQCSFDIETYSPDGSFPLAEKPECPVLQVASTYQKYGTTDFEKQLFCVGKCDPIEDVEVFECEDERELLDKWAIQLREKQVDIITGYNIWKFDLSYMFTRANFSGAEEFLKLGKVQNYEAFLRDASFSSSAYGVNHYKMLDIPGVLQLDLLVIMQREHKLTSYKLDNVAKHFLKEQKVDMPYQLMFKKIIGDSKDVKEVGEYCVQDTMLPQRLINKLAILPNMVEMSKATWVPLSFLNERGQGIKVFSQITQRTRLEDMLVITLDKTTLPENADYEGATVLAAKKGAYTEIPITGLDFASLYPTIMRAHNLDHSTYVMDKKYDNIPGVEYFEINGHRFAQNHEGIIPKMLKDLALNRKAAKKEMAKAEAEGDVFKEKLFNGKQLAFKVSMNSMYGFCGAMVGMLPCKPVAESTTAEGRCMIEKTKTLVEEWYPGSEVVYGDSVLPDTPVIIRKNGEVSVKTIETLSDEWREYPGFIKEGSNKEQSEINDIEAWTHLGWKPIKRVIRHKCKKKIYRVLTHTGMVDVTEDHSLLSPNIDLLKPNEIEIGTKLYHSFPHINKSDTSVSDEKLFLLGMFVGDGSCGRYTCPSGKKTSWAINNKDLTLLHKCKTYLQNEYPSYDFKIMDTLESSGVYKLSPRGDIISFVDEWRNLCYDGKYKKVPICAMGNKSFLNGLWAADGCRKDEETIGCHRIDTKNQLTSQWYFIYLRTLGYNVSINTRKDKTNIFRLTFTEKQQRKVIDEVKKIDILYDEWDDFVYDLETEAGTFQAGVGQMVVKNTDSVMVQFNVGDLRGQEAIDRSFELGEEAADRISATFKKPIELEFEKVYLPYLLYSKKRYAGLMYTKPEKPDYIDAKGIQLVRRDNAPFVKDISKKVLDKIMYDNDVYGAMDLVRGIARDLLTGKISVDDLVVSKSMRDNYKNDNQPHLAVAKKIEERMPGTGPKSGERVPYVFVDTKNKKHKQFEKAEDPEYVKEHGIPLDLMYYLDHSLKSPMSSLFEVFVEDPSEELFGDIIRDYYNRKGKQSAITSFFM